MLIREYTSNDISSMFTINKACHEKPQPNVSLLEQVHKGQVWVAIENDKIVGFLLSTWKEGPYIYNLAVLPEYRNKGIGTALMATFHEFYKGQGFAYLYVSTENIAQKLYFDLGYRVVDLKEDFYGPQQDAMVMVKNY